MGSDKSVELLKQIETFLNGMSEAEKKEITELQFTAIKHVKNSTQPVVCFELVAAVPFKNGAKSPIKKV